MTKMRRSSPGRMNQPLLSYDERLRCSLGVPLPFQLLTMTPGNPMKFLATTLLILFCFGCNQGTKEIGDLEKRLGESEYSKEKLEADNASLEKALAQATKDIAALEKRARTMEIQVTPKGEASGDSGATMNTEVQGIVEKYRAWESSLSQISVGAQKPECQQDRALRSYNLLIVFYATFRSTLSELAKPTQDTSLDLGALKTQLSGDFEAMAEALAESYTGLIGTDDWQAKLDLLKAELEKKPYAWDATTFHAQGFPKLSSPCYAESPDLTYGADLSYYGSVSFEKWLYSFWLRRYLDGTDVVVAKALEFVLGKPLATVPAQPAE